MRMGIYSSGGIMGIKSRDLWKIVITIHPEHVEFTLIHQQKMPATPWRACTANLGHDDDSDKMLPRSGRVEQNAAALVLQTHCHSPTFLWAMDS